MIKPGYKTSEFWFTAVSFVFSGLYLIGLIGDNTQKEDLIRIVKPNLSNLLYKPAPVVETIVVVTPPSDEKLKEAAQKVIDLLKDSGASRVNDCRRLSSLCCDMARLIELDGEDTVIKNTEEIKQANSLSGLMLRLDIKDKYPKLAEAAATGVSDASGSNVTFNNYAYCGGSVFGSVTLNDNSYVGGTPSISADVTFNDSSYAVGTPAAHAATFNDNAYNSSNLSVTNGAVFNDSTYNDGTVSGNATFKGSAYNSPSGTVSGDATFRGSSYNKANIGGNVILAYEKGINGSSILGII